MNGNKFLKITGIFTLIITMSIFPASSQGLLDDLFGSPTDEGPGNPHYVSFSQKYSPGQIVVSFSDRRLYFVNKRGKAYSYPIAVPADKARWQGRLKVTAKREDPAWVPTAQMRREDPRLPAKVPGGHPKNPLGKRALYLGNTLYRIHGTDAPWTIGSAVSKGCIRMHNEDVIDLYRKVPIGTDVIVTWKRFHS
ncbi:MAG: L,D-transpeptidase [Methyloligellaceae bacterium]